MTKIKRFGLALLLFVFWIFPHAAQAQTSPAEVSYQMALYGPTFVTLDPARDLLSYLDEVAEISSLLDPFEGNLYFYRLDAEAGRYQAVMEHPPEILERQQATIDEAEAWAAALATGLSDRQIAQALNSELIRRVDYDAESYAAYEQGLAVDNRIFSADGALLDGLAVCDGYAGAAMLMARSAGLPCIKVLGTIKGVNHAWNKVYLREEGRWLYLDVTNNDFPGLVDPEDTSLQPAFLVNEQDLRALGFRWNKDLESIGQAISYPTLVPEAIQALASAGLLAGRGPGDYAEGETLTRQELAAFLTRIQGAEKEASGKISGFPDVDPWAEGVVAYCREQDLLVGYPDGSFGGRKPVSKKEWATIVLRLYDPEGLSEWPRVEEQAERYGLVNPGRRSGVWGHEVRRADVFDSLVRSRDLIGLSL